MQANWIIGHFPAHTTFVDVFCGSGSVLMNKPRCYAEVINDIDEQVVNVFRVLRDPATARELERVQTVPDNYTSCVSDTQRYKMLGNGWTVDVIAYILSFAMFAKKP